MNVHEEVKKLKRQGKTNKEISQILQISIYSVCYHNKKDSEVAYQRKKAKDAAYETFKTHVIDIIDECNSLNEVCCRLGLRGVDGYYQKIKKIIEEEHLDTSHFGTLKRNYGGCFAKLSNEEYFKENTRRGGANLLNRLIECGIKTWVCENPDCQLTMWHGTKIPLQVHHINGDHLDNRIENLQLLCPNCHAMTETYSRRKKHEANKNENTFEYEKLVEKESIKRLKEEAEKEKMFSLFNKYHSFVQVGVYLGISDNAVRKRCKRLGILEEILQLKHENKT